MKTLVTFFFLLAALNLFAADSTVVYFAYNSTTMLNPEVLNNVGKVTRVEAHTCKVGNAEGNMRLSKSRAATVVNSLTNVADSVVVVSFGEERATTYTAVDRKVVIYWEAFGTPMVDTTTVKNLVPDVDATGDYVKVDVFNSETFTWKKDASVHFNVSFDNVDTCTVFDDLRYLDSLNTVLDSTTVSVDTNTVDSTTSGEEVVRTKEEVLDSFFLTRDAECGCGDLSNVDFMQVRYYNSLGARANTTKESVCAAFCYAKARRLFDGYWSKKALSAADQYKQNVGRVNNTGHSKVRVSDKKSQKPRSNRRVNRGGVSGSVKKSGMSWWTRTVMKVFPYFYCK